MTIRQLYRSSLALFTDLYELTMAYGYWKLGMADREAVFHLVYRNNPFGGGFALAAGLEDVVSFLQQMRFDASDLSHLQGLAGPDGHPLFERGFLDYLEGFSFRCDVDAIPEGTTVFPQEPLLRVRGPILDAQLVEGPLLTLINFQTLIATKAARVSWAARPDPVVEFGLRRAQGVDGSISASRAAYVGGCHATSSVIAGKLYGIPVRGTQAHSWVMAFDREEEAFSAFAQVMPGNCTFLVDTYDTLTGVQKAIQVGKELRLQGKEMVGIRLDSGDLAQLSIEARKLLDEAGFSGAQIMASNELDEQIIQDLKQQGAKITLWGVGTHLVTGKAQSALDGVYKLSMIRDAKGAWSYRLKLSQQLAKISTPGQLQVRRFFRRDTAVGDVIYDTLAPPLHEWRAVENEQLLRTQGFPSDLSWEDLLVPVMRQGKSVYTSPSLHQIREMAREGLHRFDPSLRRFLNPPSYFVGLERGCFDRKMELVAQKRQAK